MNSIFKKTKSIKIKKITSIFLALIMIFQILGPTVEVYAKTNPVFEKENEAGIEITYRIISETDNNNIGKVSVGDGKNNAIDNNEAITSIKIPKTIVKNGRLYEVGEIGENAFKNNKSLEIIALPQTVEKIGASAFMGCENLKDITLQKNIQL